MRNRQSEGTGGARVREGGEPGSREEWAGRREGRGTRELDGSESEPVAVQGGAGPGRTRNWQELKPGGRRVDVPRRERIALALTYPSQAQSRPRLKYPELL